MTIKFELIRPTISLKCNEDEVVLTTSITVTRGIRRLQHWPDEFIKPPFHATGEVMLHTPDSPIMWHHFTLNERLAESDPFNDAKYAYCTDDSFTYDVCRHAMDFLVRHARGTELFYAKGFCFVKNMWIKVDPRETR